MRLHCKNKKGPLIGRNEPISFGNSKMHRRSLDLYVTTDFNPLKEEQKLQQGEPQVRFIQSLCFWLRRTYGTLSSVIDDVATD